MQWLGVLFGGIVGLSLGMTGGGGAIFAVPLLVYGLATPAREAVGISLVSVGLTSLIGFLQKWSRGEAELKTGFLFAAAGMIGAPIGTWLAQQLPESMLMILFAGLMITIAAKMWRKSQARRAAFIRSSVPTDSVQANCTTTVSDDRNDPSSCQRDTQGQLILTSRCARLLILVGIGSGILSGMFGVGGGFIIVPALMIFSGMSMLRAVGTSLMVIALVSVSGIVSQIWTGQSISTQTAAAFLMGSIPGLWLGQRLAARLSPATLEKLFSVAILFVAVFVLFKNVHRGS